MVDEAVVKEEAKKSIEYGFEDGKVFLRIDSDKDGEYLMEIKVSVSEAMQEAMAALTKKK
jgi:hypothetical protein